MAVWAYAASRVLDYALTLPVIDPHACAVVGHSRLGKTAVFAGAMDERFALTISNNSGCSGAAIHRGKNGERIFNITDKFSRWFTEDFTAWQNREEELPFDQHTVLGLVAPVCCTYAVQPMTDGPIPYPNFSVRRQLPRHTPFTANPV